MILAPLRGVTVRSFRKVFSGALAEYGFTEAFTPFITANSGVDPLKDRELKRAVDDVSSGRLLVTPQFIGKDPAALKFCLQRIKEHGYKTADLNCGCPYPMVRNKFRGSGLLKTRDVLMRMIETGCDVMGAGAFSIKTRLGVERTDELLGLMQEINRFPLRFLTVHARTARQMYDGECDMQAFSLVASQSAIPLVFNGDAAIEGGRVRFPLEGIGDVQLADVMIGRAFVRELSKRNDIGELLERYILESIAEFGSDKAVLGRMKELLAYWAVFPAWARIWRIVKMARSVEELRMIIAHRISPSD